MICSKKNAFFDFFDFCIEGSPLWIDFGKICRRKNFWNFQKKFQKWPVQDSSNIARNKLIKNQPVWGTHQWAANNKPPCRIGLIGTLKLIALCMPYGIWIITLKWWCGTEQPSDTAGRFCVMRVRKLPSLLSMQNPGSFLCPYVIVLCDALWIVNPNIVQILSFRRWTCTDIFCRHRNYT